MLLSKLIVVLCAAALAVYIIATLADLGLKTKEHWKRLLK